MGVQRTIEHSIADANDNAGDQVGVHSDVATWLHANRFFHPRFDNLANVVVQLSRNANVYIGHAALLSEELFGLARDGSQNLEPTVAREDFEEICHMNRSS